MTPDADYEEDLDPIGRHLDKWEPWHIILLVFVVFVGIACIFHGMDWMWRTS